MHRLWLKSRAIARKEHMQLQGWFHSTWLLCMGLHSAQETPKKEHLTLLRVGGMRQPYNAWEVLSRVNSR